MSRRRSHLALPCSVCIVLGACGPSVGDGESTRGTTASTTDDTATPTSSSTSSTSSTSSLSSPGGSGCGFTVGAGEPTEPDPDGCYAIASEAGCKQQGLCTALFGDPVICDEDGPCRAGPAVFLGCRPFIVCKMSSDLLCHAGPGGDVEPFFSVGCMPEGFGLCEPRVDLAPDQGLRSCG